MLSDEVVGFLRSAVKSVWALETLLFLRRHAGRTWTVDALAAELRSSRTVVVDVLGRLVQSGLVQAEDAGAHRYLPASEPLDRLVQQVGQAYAERPIAVVTAILSGPHDKVQIFADAFRIKKE